MRREGRSSSRRNTAATSATGRQGKGSPITGPKLAPNPIPYEALSAFVRTSAREMPPYREQVLPNEDLQDIYAYLQSIKPGPDYKSIPLLND